MDKLNVCGVPQLLRSICLYGHMYIRNRWGSEQRLWCDGCCIELTMLVQVLPPLLLWVSFSAYVV
jgi:hypothetical protein